MTRVLAVWSRIPANRNPLATRRLHRVRNVAVVKSAAPNLQVRSYPLQVGGALVRWQVAGHGLPIIEAQHSPPSPPFRAPHRSACACPRGKASCPRRPRTFCAWAGIERAGLKKLQPQGAMEFNLILGLVGGDRFRGQSGHDNCTAKCPLMTQSGHSV